VTKKKASSDLDTAPAASLDRAVLEGFGETFLADFLLAPCSVGAGSRPRQAAGGVGEAKP